MAIAPVNKFINLAVPIAPGENKLYEVPTGTSALLLYAQVANVGIGTTFPKVTFIQRRQTRSTGLTRDIRVIKDVEIPPNDAVILIDGRLVLEKTALVVDSLYMTGTQTGITTIDNVTYDEPTGIVTVSCAGTHGYSVGSEITLAGIAFTCPSGSGITTNIFPDPQKSYIVDSIVDTVGTSKTFTSIVGGATGITHVYNTAIHNFVRAKPDAISFTNLSNANKYNVTAASYKGSTGIITFTIPDHQMITDDGSTYTPTNAVYDARVGIMTVTLNGHPFVDGNLVKFGDESLPFKCTMDGNTNVKLYPRRGRDKMSGRWKEVNKISNNKFEVDIGKSPFDYFDVSAALYDPNSGIATLTIGKHNIEAGITSIRLSPKSLKFSCTQGGGGISTYPRPSGYAGATSNDFAYQNAVGVAATTDTSISVQVLATSPSTNVTPHTFVVATPLQPTDATYNPATGVMQLTIVDHGFEDGDGIKMQDNSITFSCDYGGYVGVTSHKSYPRAGKDPFAGKWMEVTRVNANNISVNVGASPDLSPHTFVSATAGITRSVVKTGGAYNHTFDTATGAVAGSMLRSTNTIGIATESIIFTCTMDNNLTQHAYPRTSDPAHNTGVKVVEADYNTVSVNVGVSSAGGQTSPLQLELIASVLENSNA
tara:strand:- start:705 stop:2660 length:1956 start_codon:yes stop_codon:yes gene_type:complete